MPRGSVYGTKEDDLNDADQNFLEKYRKFQGVLRRQKVSPLDASSVAEHRQTIKHKEISIATQEECISELLRYHGWACLERGLYAHQVRLTKILISYEDLYSYCQFLEKQRGVKLWSLNKICQAIIGMLKFIRTKFEHASVSEVDKMLSDTRALYASIARSSQVSLNERPSLCERRERGEALSFLDIVKVCESQHWRVKVLSTFRKRGDLTLDLKEAIRGMLMKEVERLAVLFTLLKYPTRKIEAQRCIIEKVGGTWRLKLSAIDRKRGRFPIDVKLSSMEVQIFHFLRGLNDTSTSDGWKPFEAMNMTQILKSVTYEITGVGVTVTDLRSAAESHVDIIGYNCKNQSENIQKALSYAEGHSENIAKMFYKRNGSHTIMKAWTTYVNKLMSFQEAETEESMCCIDQAIMNSINKSQETWVNEVQHKIWRIQSALKGKTKAPSVVEDYSPRKRRKEWSTEEDEELKRCVKLHGEGNWKVILDSSSILKDRYSLAPSVDKARAGLKDRWRNLKKEKSDNTDYHDYPSHEWSLAEDNALELAVSIYGTSWKEILDNSKMFREMYDHMPVEKARAALKDRWRKLTAADGNTKSESKLKPIDKTKSIQHGSQSEPKLRHRRKKKGRQAALKNNTCEFRFGAVHQKKVH